jgi:hypothetical protein
MAQLTYYRKNRLIGDFECDCFPATLSKKDIIKYITSVTNTISYRLEKLSWKKLMIIFYRLNAKDAKKAYNELKTCCM